MGKGTVAAEGSYALHTGADTAYKLHFTAKDAEVASAIVNGRVNSDIEIVPQKYLDYKTIIRVRSRRNIIVLQLRVMYA